MAWPLFVAAVAYMFGTYVLVHAMAYFGLDGWLAYQGIKVLWVLGAFGAYWVLVLIEKKPIQDAIKLTVWGMLATGSLGYAWHYGAASRDGQLAQCEFRAAYDHAEAQRLAQKLGERPLELVVPTALPPKEAPPAVKAEAPKAPPAPVKLYKPRPKSKAVNPFAN